MKKAFQKGFILSSLVFSTAVFANTIDGPDSVDQQDVQALRDWINSKRQITLKELGGSLSLAGEVRFELQSMNEKVNGYRQRGPGGLVNRDGFPYASNAWDVEVNLMLDYRTDRTWAAIKLEFDNNAGVYGGSLDRIKLEKAYLGGRVIQTDTYSLAFEIGRRRLSTFLDSKLEFSAFFDGLLMRVEKNFEKAGDLYTVLGSFIVDERNSHYAYVGEIGLLNAASTGLYTKYSVIDWNARSHYVVPGTGLRFDFIVSQLILGYRFVPVSLEKVVRIYMGGLYNHAAKRYVDRSKNQTVTNYTKANAGGYLGFSIGEARKRGDWSFDLNYQVLQAQCVPDFDMAGIGTGNTADAGLYNSKIDGTGTPVTQSRNARGNGNFRGYQVTLDYLLTDAIMIQQAWQQSQTLDAEIGPYRRYSQYEIEFIYAF